jgi:hypothetical protein
LVDLSHDTGLHDIGHGDEDVIGRVAVQWSAETLLVEVVADEANAASEDEETIESTNADIFVCFFSAKGTAVSQEINETDSNAAIDVEDEGILLGSGDLLNSKRVVEQRVAGEALIHVVLNELDTQIRVVDALDLVADTTDYGNRQSPGIPLTRIVRTKLVGLARLVDELARSQPGITSVREHCSGLI